MRLAALCVYARISDNYCGRGRKKKKEREWEMLDVHRGKAITAYAHYNLSLSWEGYGETARAGLTEKFRYALG